MTAGLPYLRNLRKTDLIELAQVSRLRNYEDLMKKDLETVLDKHLWSNRTKLASEGQLADYYRRLTTATPGKTPAKTPTRRTPVRAKSESTTAESR
ncbi:hypothetical protein KEM55_005659 [Ascosphaera atra]|nr:hypothetical protein KEM55_005659 [Ascosphaera atra]